MGKENNAFICVLPYAVSEIESYERYYDDVIIPECVATSHPKVAIVQRNQWMIQQADLAICYVERREGGAYVALKHAQKLNKPVLNLALDEEEKI